VNVLLICQCDKRALNESRRILDQFAERRGERTWQTPITQQGLDTLRRLLKKTARRNTSVACHWIRGRDHSELLWVVGDASRFNAQGAVPTNTSERNVLRSQDENDWHTGDDIRLLAGLAALFHDFGKASQAFQHKLRSKKPLADAYRHEWVSLRLFQAFVGDDSDEIWLQRLASLTSSPADNGWQQRLHRDGLDKGLRSPFKKLPPLARAIGWLILSHHRLPVQPYSAVLHSQTLTVLPQGLMPEWNAAREQASPKDKAACWTFKQPLLFASQHWCEHAAKLAERMLARSGFSATDWLLNPYVTHVARLVLMLADHHYSSEPTHTRYGDAGYPLYANTDRDTGALKQRLDEHLIGVAVHSGRIARSLPQLLYKLPSIARHKGFKRRSEDAAFRWQDKAYDLAASLQARSTRQGFFGVNMASTGCGKTLANGRILYGLADPQRGARFSIALGLRSLTLQTGQAYRERLKLGEDDLAVVVGGAAVKELFERANAQLTNCGSESAEALLSDDSYVHYQGCLEDGALKQWLGKNSAAQRLLDAPILVSTVDHLIPATEGTRGGRQIAPMLRLMTSDLVLDEPDDFDLNDLPALSRLVFWAGLLGSRVLLSSATLPPALIEGLFAAYLEGRRSFQANRGVPGQPLAVCCAWFDEYGVAASEHAAVPSFADSHGTFVAKRTVKLAQAEVRRVAQILPLPITQGGKAEVRSELAGHLHRMIHELHRQHHSLDPYSQKRVSFGLIRMANIDPMLDVAQLLFKLGAETGCRIHLCCYHARHLLLMRSAIEKRLDRLLRRHQPEAIFADPELRAWLDASPEPEQIFVLLASPVAEVGRDHDYDWGIVEPSSMRSIIQLAGRIRRHRPGPCKSPNLYLLERNVKALEGQTPAFCRPGFESQDFPLASHSLSDLLSAEQLAMIDARPRIAERSGLQPRTNLVDLEHVRLRALMLSNSAQSGLPVPLWWQTQAALSGELQRKQRFRDDPLGHQRYVLEPDEDEQLHFKLQQEDGQIVEVDYLLEDFPLEFGPRIDFWGQPDYLVELTQLADALDLELPACARRFGVIDLAKKTNGMGWRYHPALGFRGYL
jgi:CRISPR-associated endonuclease/helicase Cas3